MKTKEEILMNIVNDLNSQSNSWEVSVEGDQIIAYWKWKDGIYFSTEEITDEVKDFKFIVTLLDNGRWKELDVSSEKVKGANFANGKLSFGTSGFVGHKTQKSFEMSFGKKRDEDEFGVQVNKFDTKQIKEPIRTYLTNCGWKKKGLF
jgi:hypothetical protein